MEKRLGSLSFLNIEVFHDHILRDAEFLVLAVGAHEHCVVEQLFDDGTEATGTSMAFDGQAGDFPESIIVERKFDSVEFEQLGVLLDDGVLRFGQDSAEGVLVEFVKSDGNGESAYEFRHESELHEVIRFALIEEFAEAFLFPRVDGCTESHTAFLSTL